MNIDAKAREIAENINRAFDPVELIAAALLSVRNEALEEAAKVATVFSDPSKIADRIRALKEGT